MKEEFPLLVRLRDLDREIHAARTQLALYPKMLADLDATESKCRAKLKEATDRHAAEREARRKSEKDVLALRQKADRCLVKQGQVKTNKECAAVNEEIDGIRAEIDERDMDGLEHLEGEEQAEKDTRAAQSELDDFLAVAATERERIEGQKATKAGRLEALLAERPARMEVVPEGLREPYELLNEKYPGQGVVEVTDNRSCPGCGRDLRQQHVIDVHRMERLVRCENCMRILFDPAVLEP